MLAPDPSPARAAAVRYKILVAHNFYQSSSPSGEDEAFTAESELLRQAGHDVRVYAKRNDALQSMPLAALRAAANCAWSQTTYDELSDLLTRDRPDLVHFHNTFPLISPSAYAACKDHRVPVVQTLHNYRLVCPGALLLRDGRPCEDCVGGSPWPSVRHGCYRGSALASAAVAHMLTTHRRRGTYRDSVDAYIALTDFARSRFVRGGLPPQRIVVRPNSLVNPPEPGTGSGNYALYVGRLSAEKGARTLIEAWRDPPGLPLKVVGDGPLRGELERRAGPSVEMLGRLERQEVYRLMRDATVLVIPSECYEGFPMTVLEGLACGAPLVVAAIGALDTIVQAPAHGRKFAPGNALELAHTVAALTRDGVELRAMRARNRLLFDREYSPERARASLEDVYRRVVETAGVSVQ